MLTYDTTSTNSFGRERIDMGIYDKCHGGHYIQDMDPMALTFTQHQQRTPQNSRPVRKAKQPIDQHEYYLALVVDPYTGKVSKRASSTLKNCKDDVLSDAASKLSYYMKSRMSDTGFVDEYNDNLANDTTSAIPKPAKGKRGKERSQRPSKKRKGGDEFDVSDSASQEDTFVWRGGEDPDDGSQYVAYRADATADWSKWFSDAFRAVQQISCRVIAKEWIKIIHPKKQSTHPYNGKNPRTGEKGDSNSTKPPYWPEDVIHREPDHVLKKARIKILVHLLMKTPHKEMSVLGDSNKQITAEMLMDCLEQKRADASCNIDIKWPIIQQIIDVRTVLEQYEDGGISGETMITAPNFSEYNRAKKDEDSDEQDEAAECADQADDDEYIDVVKELPPQDEVPTTMQNPAMARARSETYRDKEPRSQRGSRRTSRNDEPRNPTASANRRVPRARQISNQQPSLMVHPPMVLPDWNNFSASPMQQDHRAHSRQQNGTPQSMHEGFHPSQWAHLQPGSDLGQQYNDYCMLTPPPMPNSLQHGAYVDAGFAASAQQSFPGMPHSAQFDQPVEYANEIHDSRHPQMRGPPDFDPFANSSQSEQRHEMMRRAYYM